jgi:hypothetical protein
MATITKIKSHLRPVGRKDLFGYDTLFLGSPIVLSIPLFSSNLPVAG